MKKEDKWQDSFREASEEVGFWRKKHPKATFSEIEECGWEISQDTG